MRKGFTLIELLTVMMIMALMGTAAIGGYRAMQRGMEERGVMQNANAAIRAVYQRAQIDRQPAAIFFWNETLSPETEDANAVVVGKAVAVRRHGRLSNRIGQFLYDEFGDLEQAYPINDANAQSGGGSNSQDTMFLYPMENLAQMGGSSRLLRSTVKSSIVKRPETPNYYTTTEKPDNGEIDIYAYELVEENSVGWKAGMAYGFEFMSIQLPHGYIFGNDFSTTTDNSVRPIATFVFKPGVNTNSGLNTDGVIGGTDTIQVSVLRPRGATLVAERVGTTDSPERRL